MAKLSVTNLSKTYGGGTQALKPCDFDIADGEFVVLVGPSGCGKSTLLRMIAGLEDISTGDLRIGDRVVNDLDPAARDIAMVFQNYALYPHMSVRKNIGYGLKNRKVPAADIAQKVEQAAEILNLTEYLDRRPSQLSGGQRQRVAMGRAIVRDPALFLFDEPLSNLDAKLRNQMRIEIRALQRRLGVTSVYVTHDQVEAMTMADRIFVLNGGVIEQIGTPSEIYDSPASTFVASFMGAPPMNLLSGSRDAAGNLQLDGGATVPSAPDVAHSGAVTIGIRPEDVILDPAGMITFDATIVEELGAQRLLHGAIAGQAFSMAVAKDVKVSAGALRLGLKPSAVHLFHPETGKRL